MGLKKINLKINTYFYSHKRLQYVSGDLTRPNKLQEKAFIWMLTVMYNLYNICRIYVP